jgi:polysaccharide export outer membrane protein
MIAVDRYGQPIRSKRAKLGPKKYKTLWHKLRDEKHISYQTPPPPGMFQQWVDWEPEYKLVEGDQLDIVVSSAPELSRTLTVGPDGRVVMPMSRPIMAAGRTFIQVQNELMGELGKQLRDPTIAVTPRAYAPEQIYVGGQVGQPGTYTIPGRIGALEGILMAGGLSPTARSRDIAILRRAPNGGMMMRSVNIRGGLLNIREYNDNIQLRRGDIIYVPQSTLGEVGRFMQNFRSALPVDFNLSYQFGQNQGGTTVVSP